MWHGQKLKIAGLENAKVEISARYCRGWKSRSAFPPIAFFYCFVPIFPLLHFPFLYFQSLLAPYHAYSLHGEVEQLTMNLSRIRSAIKIVQKFIELVKIW